MKGKVHQFKVSSLLGVLLILGTFVGCGQQEIALEKQISNFVAGAFSTKIDLVLVLDDSPSASFNQASDLRSGVQGFVQNLINTGQDWDMRILAVSLSDQNLHSKIWTNKPTFQQEQIIPSQYLIDQDGNGVSSSNELSRLLDFYQIDNSVGLYEEGLNHIVSFLYGYANQANFIREESQLAIVVFSNGNDISESLLQQGSLVPNPNVSQVYMDNLSALKDNIESHVRFYSVVANSYHSNRSCNGNNAKPGGRYLTVQNYFANASGQSVPNLDICSQGSFNQAMNTVSSQIQPIVKARFNRIGGICPNIISSIDLDNSNVNVSVRINGQTIPHDSAACDLESQAINDSTCNGWRYERYYSSYETRPNMRIAPEPGQLAPPGHLIRLNGSSQYFTGDQIEVICQ